MCLPVLAIAGIAATLAGAGMNYLGQQKADHAMTSTFNREHDRQKAFEAQQQVDFQNSLDSTKNVLDPASQAAATARRDAALMAATKSAGPSAGGYLPGSSSASPIVNAHATAAGAAADKRTGALAAALASLGGMGDLMQTNDINIGHNSQDIAQIGGFKRGSLDVLQSEMDAAKRKGNTLRTLGGLAQSIGSAMLSGGGGAPIGGSGAGLSSALSSGAYEGIPGLAALASI